MNGPVTEQRRSVWKRVLHVFSWIVFVAVLSIAGLMLIPSLLGFDRYVIVSGSMEPAIGTGSVVYDRAVPVEELSVGDVVTFMPPPEFHQKDPVTHRIHKISRGSNGTRRFRTKGDANESVDPWTIVFDRPEQARVEHHIEKVGYVYVALSNRWVQLLVIGLPAMLLFALIVIALWREAGEAVTREERSERLEPRPA